MARSETSATDRKIRESASNKQWSQLSKREPCMVPAIKKKSAIEDTVMQKHTCKTIVPTYFTTKAPPMTITPNVRAAKKGRFESNFCVTLKSLFQLTQTDSMFSCVCSVTDHRWRQMWIQKKLTRRRRVCHWCSFPILTSSVIYLCGDARQHGIHLLYMIRRKNVVHGDIIFVSVPQQIIRKNQP